jgi:organic hydroperoxide reductase OsmC/OhrA
MAKQMKLNPGPIDVRSAVGIGTIEPSGFGLTVHLDVTVKGLSQADAEKVVAAGHKLCPYSNAIRNNVDVTISVKAA